jgi:hypothetical protein
MLRQMSRAGLAAAALLIFPSLCGGQTTAPKKTPKITAVRFGSFPPSKPDSSVETQLEIDGENLPLKKEHVTILFDFKDPAHPFTCSPSPCEPLADPDGNEIVLKGSVTAGTEITRIRILQNGTTIADSKDFDVSIKANAPKPALPQFGVKLEPETNKEFPNLHALVITKSSGGSDVGFADNPHWMTVDLMPSGATDINIVQTSREQMVLHFVAAADYKPTSLAVTVYTGSDLDTRTVKAIATSTKTPEDTDQPKVTGIETVFISRSHGIGRFRILGSGFGDYPVPPYQVDDYLWNCLEEFHIRGTQASADWVRDAERSDLESRLKACQETLSGTSAGDGAGAVDITSLQKRLSSTKTNLATYVTGNKDAADWGGKIRDAVTVSVHSRNPDIRVERVEILNINDKMIDVYFEFTRYRGYSYPLRLDDGTVTIKKTVQKATQTVTNNKLTGTVTGKQETYTVPYQVGLKRDTNLTYKYTVLDQHSANTLLGKGIADNFYVLQLSVLNDGANKVAIPLAAIQAEIEWVRGTSDLEKKVSFVEGPPTLSPIPLGAVSGYFDAYQKVKGFRAHFFNALDAATVIATALVPVTGPSFKDAELFFSGALVPGIHKGLGDLSSQQLQALTSLSWQNSETLPAKGGSMEKLIYIQKKSSPFESNEVKAIGVGSTMSQIAFIMGLEVTGYEVADSTPKAATPAPATSTPAKTTTPAAPAAPPAPAPAKPATPASAEQ